MYGIVETFDTVVGWSLGMISLYVYIVLRMKSNPVFDTSNVHNPMRLLDHVVVHGDDFPRMYYITDEQMRVIEKASPTLAMKLQNEQRPFHYVGDDEITDIVKTRPPK